MGRYNEESASPRKEDLTYSCIRRLLVSDATETCSTDDRRFQGIIVIIVGFQVAVVHISEKPLDLNQRTVEMEQVGAVLTSTDWQG